MKRDSREYMQAVEDCRFSIFYCGCKLPKSLHKSFSGAKIQQANEKPNLKKRKWKKNKKEGVLYLANW